MKERPILFSGPMVRALLEGRKTQTRRIMKPQPPTECSIHYMLGDESWLPPEKRQPLRHHWEAWRGPLYENRPEKYLCGVHEVRCPYGAPGDRLWVRETWRSNAPQRVAYASDGWCGALVHDGGGGIIALHHGWLIEGPNRDKGPSYGEGAYGDRWRPSIHMPRWASRLTLDITRVRVERLNDISEDDARAEGVKPFPYDPEGDCWTDGKHRTAFEYLWGEINGWDGEPKARAPWTTNPWVWVLDFKRVAQRERAA